MNDQRDAPLQSLAVLVTRPQHQAQRLCELIAAAGGVAHAVPMLEILPAVDPAAVLQTIGDPSSYDLLVFVSSNAVRHALDYLPDGPSTLAQIAAVGPSTAKALRDAGLRCDVVPGSGYASEDLLEEAAMRNVQGRHALIFRGNGGRPLLGDTLAARGAQVTYADVYRRAVPSASAARLQALLDDHAVQVATATSVETLDNLIAVAGPARADALRELTLLTASPRVADKAVEAGFRPTPILADGPDDQALVDALTRWRTHAAGPGSPSRPQAASGDAAAARDAVAKDAADSAPGSASGSAPGSASGSASGSAPDSASDSAPDSASDSAPESASGSAPDPASNAARDAAPDAASDAEANAAPDARSDGGRPAASGKSRRRRRGKRGGRSRSPGATETSDTPGTSADAADAAASGASAVAQTDRAPATAAGTGAAAVSGRRAATTAQPPAGRDTTSGGPAAGQPAAATAASHAGDEDDAPATSNEAEARPAADATTDPQEIPPMTTSVPAEAPPGASTKPARGGRLLAALALLLALVACAAAGWNWRQAQQARSEVAALAANLPDGDAIVADARRQAEQSGDALRRDVDARIAKVDLSAVDALSAEQGNLANSVRGQARNVATLTERLSRLEQDLGAMQGISTSVRDTWVRAEAEYFLQTANSRLQLAHDVDSALQALRAADERIGALGDPALTPVRALVAEEILAVEALPRPDVPGIALALNGLAERVPSLPVDTLSPGAYSVDGPRESDASGWQRAKESVVGVLGNIVRVSPSDGSSAAVMAPEQSWFLFRNLELQLHAARLALLDRDEENFRGSLATAVRWLDDHFVADDPAVISAKARLTELQDVDIDPPMPDISRSLRRLRDVVAATGTSVR